MPDTYCEKCGYAVHVGEQGYFCIKCHHSVYFHPTFAELKEQNAELLEAVAQHIYALHAWQYSQTPVPALPEIAPTANVLARLLESAAKHKEQSDG